MHYVVQLAVFMKKTMKQIEKSIRGYLKYIYRLLRASIWQAKLDKNRVFSDITNYFRNITNSFINITSSFINII